MTEREKLARKCLSLCYGENGWQWDQVGDDEHNIWYGIADFIIADRKRIAEPAKKSWDEWNPTYMPGEGGTLAVNRLLVGIKETLVNAGIDL